MPAIASARLSLYAHGLVTDGTPPPDEVGASMTNDDETEISDRERSASAAAGQSWTTTDCRDVFMSLTMTSERILGIAWRRVLLSPLPKAGTGANSVLPLNEFG